MIFGMATQIAGSRAWKESGSVCHYCDVPLTTETATRDHILPRRGSGRGTDGLRNTVIACMPCNSRKGDGDYHVFQQSEWLRDRRNAVSLGIVKTGEALDSKSRDWTTVPQKWVTGSAPSKQQPLSICSPVPERLDRQR